ncbi:hypothetical protein ACHAXN_008166 [Cyclotella atomus]
MMPYQSTFIQLTLVLCQLIHLSVCFSAGARAPISNPRAAVSNLHRQLSTRTSPIVRTPTLIYSSAEDSNEQEEAIDISVDSRLRRVRLSRATGIEWGTDLSFSFVYVRDLEPAGSASLSDQVEVGDQICELRSVSETGELGEPANLIGAGFDVVMNAFASLDRSIQDIEIVFFRGSKEELKDLCTGGASQENEDVTITVVQNKGARDENVRTIKAKAGCNVRQVLTDNGINVYQSVTRWTNCKGKQLCGTCIVNIAEGGGSTNRKSLDEASTLRENPDSYRLSCVTFAYGDVTVETFPPIEAAQWTR